MKIIQSFLKKGLTNKPLKAVKGIVIHYVANPGSSAKANRNYWENLGTGIGAHYIVDLDGTILHTVPDNMMAYHVGSKTYTKEALQRLSSYPNDCTIGIEMTHPDATGKPTDATYKATVELAASLCKKYKLTEKDLWLHKEVVGWKLCHKYYVEHPDAWQKFKNDVKELLNNNSTPKTTTTSKPKYVLPDGVLKLGDKGNAVKQLQTALNAAGFNCGTPDGIFGQKTLNALKRFQSIYCKPADGVYGPKTKAALAKKLGL